MQKISNHPTEFRETNWVMAMAMSTLIERFSLELPKVIKCKSGGVYYAEFLCRISLHNTRFFNTKCKFLTLLYSLVYAKMYIP